MKIGLSLLVLLSAAPVLAVPLSVSVVDVKGAPVADADVQLESFGKTPRGYVLHQTNGQGVVIFDVEPMSDSIYGDFAGRVFVRKNGFAIGNGKLLFKTPLRVELSPPSKISGKVVDPEGKPIQNAQISFLSTQKNGDYSDMLIDGPLKPQMTTHSSADGSWQLDGVPPDTQVFVTVSAPERVRVRSQILSGGTGQTVLQPGAQIKGRLFGLDGKPLAGMEVSAQGTTTETRSSGATTKTGTDGTFVLDGLSGGTYNIMFNSEEEEAPFVVPAFQGVNALVGAPLQLPATRAVEGVIVAGHVLESDTKAPVAGAMIGIYGGLNPSTSAQVSSTTSDKNGFWKMRTLPGESRIYLMGPPQQFKREPDNQAHNITIGATGDMNVDFTLERLPKISGRLLDENGKGVKASVQLRRDYQEFWASSDQNGDFTTYGPTTGEWTVSPQGNWDIAGPQRVTISLDKPLEVRLKRVQLATLELGVYDDDDLAVEGARVSVEITTGEGDNQTMQPVELISDKAGRAGYENLRADQTVSIASAKKEGYDTAPLPAPDHTGRAWSASLTLIRRNGHASGQVFGPDGQLAVGTLISGSGIDTRADGTGHFELAPLPKGVTPVAAWQGDGFALGTSDQARLDLKPQTLEPTDPAKARAILDAITEQSKDGEYYWRDSLQFEVGSFDEIAQKLKQKPLKYAVSKLISRFGTDKTIPASRWFDVLQSAISPMSRLSNTASWLKTGPTIPADEDAQRFLQTLQNDVAQVETQFKSDDKSQIAHGIFAAAAFAEKSGDTQAADALFERARIFTDTAFGRESDRLYGNIGGTVAVSPRLLLKTAQLLAPTNSQRAVLLGYGIPVLARGVNLDVVKPLLDQIRAMPQPKPDSYGDTFSVDALLYQATIGSIRIAGKSNTTLALELAKALPATTTYGDNEVRDTALCEAAFFQPSEEARALWRDSLPRLRLDEAMSFLVRISKRDEPFARDYYEIVARNMDARPLPDPEARFGGPSVNPATFAFYEAHFNPARARFRLERAFAIAQTQTEGNRDMASFPKAMAIFDATRAVSWTVVLSGGVNDWSGNFETRRRIAQWLALSEEARQNASFATPHSQDWDF